MNYTLGEVTKLLEVSKSTIRNYERQGLLEISRKEDNNYRSFTEEDVWILREIRAFRGLRFSLEEIYDLMGNTGEQGVAELLQNKRHELVKEAAELLKQIDKLGHMEKKLADIHQTREPEVIEMPAFYWLKCTNENLDIQKHWTDWLPYVFISPLIYDLDKEARTSVGLGIKEKDMRELGIAVPDEALRISASHAAVVTAEKADNDPEGYYDEIRSLQDYASACGYQWKKEALVQGVFTLMGETGEKHYYTRIWLPLQDKKCATVTHF